MPAGAEGKLVLLYVNYVNQGMTACCQTFSEVAAGSKRFSKLNFEAVPLLKRINKTRLGKPNLQLVPLFQNHVYASSTKSSRNNANQFLQATASPLETHICFAGIPEQVSSQPSGDSHYQYHGNYQPFSNLLITNLGTQHVAS